MMDIDLLRPAAPLTYTPVGGGGDDGAPLTALFTQFSNVALTASTYTLTTQLKIPSGSTLKGAGIGKTVITLGANTGNLLTTDGWIRNTDFTNGNNDILLEDFEVNGNRTNRSRSSSTDDNNIFFQGSSTSLLCSRIIINRVSSYSSNGQGIHLRFCKDSYVTNCRATDNGRNNTDLTWNGIYLLRCNDSFITNCRADSQNDRSGIKVNVGNRIVVTGCVANSNPVDGFEGGGTGVSPNASDGVIYNGCVAMSNTFQGFDWNISANGANRIVLNGCVAELNTQNGIVFANVTRGAITGCVVMNNSQAGVGSWDGIRLSANTHVSIIGNQIGDDQGTHTQGNGIDVLSTTNDYIVMIGNDGTGCTVASITVAGGNANGINANNK